jgi:hypothetical protein
VEAVAVMWYATHSDVTAEFGVVLTAVATFVLGGIVILLFHYFFKPPGGTT